MSAQDLPTQAAPPARDLGWRAYALLALIAVAMFLPGQWTLPPVDRDESRYAVSTTQMLDSRDFIDVRYQNQPRYLQPVGIYWLQALSVSALSSPAARQIWAFRVPSFLSAVAAVLLTASIGATAFGAEAGFAAGLLMAACVLLGFEARMAKIDATLLAATLVAQRSLLRAYLGRVKGAGRVNAALFWAALGVGLMLKGPIILIVSGTTTLALLAIDRRFAWLKRLHAGCGVLITLAVALPWFVAIGLKTHGAFFAKSVGQNLLGKIGRGEQAHGSPPGYYLLAFTLTFWPGSLAGALALPWSWRNRIRPEVRFMAAWIVPTWLIYEAVSTKLPHYALPFYPPIACLAAAAALAPGGWRFGRLGKIAVSVYAVLWLLTGSLIGGFGAYLIWRYQHQPDALALAAFAGVAALSIAVLVALATGRRVVAVAAALAASFLLSLTLYVHSLPANTPLWLAPRIAAAERRLKPCPSSVMASSDFSEPSLIFETGIATKLINVQRTADHLAADPACALALVGREQLPAFAARAAADRVALQPLGEVDGVNYSTGKRLQLLFFRAAPQR